MAATLGELLVKLGLDPSGLTTGAVQAESAFGRLQTTMLETAKVAIGFGAAFEASRFLGDSIKASIEQEASTARLTQALKENVPAWDGNTAAIDRAIAAAGEKGFTDQEAEQSLAHLSAATHDATQAISLQSVAMDLARFRNLSLADASDKLIRVIGGSSRVAKELGIDFSKTSTEAERLGLIEQVVGGQADAFGNTTAGAMARASESIHVAEEAIGAALVPAVVALAGFAEHDLAPALKLVGDNLGIILPIAEAIGAIFVGKVALGVAQSTAMFIANSVAMIANSRLVELLTLSEGGEAVAASAAADAEFRLGAARAAAATAGGAGAGAGVAAGVTGAGLLSNALATLGAVAGTVVVPLALVGTTAAVVGATIAESGHSLNTAADGFSLTSQGVYEYGHQLAILKGYLDSGQISQAQYDAEIAKLPSQFAPAIVTMATFSQGMDESARSAIAARQATATAALGIDSAGQIIDAAQIRVAQATLEAKDAHDALAQAEKDAEDPAKAGAAAINDLAEAQIADKVATDNLKAAQDALNLGLNFGASQASHLSDEMYGLTGTLNAAIPATNAEADAVNRLAAAIALHAEAMGTLTQGPTNVEGMATLNQTSQINAYASAIQTAITNAFNTAKTASDRFWASQHTAALTAIDDEKANAIAIADTAFARDKAALEAPVTAEEATLQAKQKAEQLTHLNEAVENARASLASATSAGGDTTSAARQLRDAQAALDDFNAQANIDREKSTVAVAVTALTTQHTAAIAAANQQAADEKAAADTKAAARKQAFDDELAALEKHLKATHATHATTLADIAALYKKYGITPGMTAAQQVAAFGGGSSAAVAVGSTAPVAVGIGGAPPASLTTPGAVQVVTPEAGLLRQILSRLDTLIGMGGRFDLGGAVDTVMYSSAQRSLAGGLGP